MKVHRICLISINALAGWNPIKWHRWSLHLSNMLDVKVFFPLQFIPFVLSKKRTSNISKLFLLDTALWGSDGSYFPKLAVLRPQTKKRWGKNKRKWMKALEARKLPGTDMTRECSRAALTYVKAFLEGQAIKFITSKAILLKWLRGCLLLTSAHGF